MRKLFKSLHHRMCKLLKCPKQRLSYHHEPANFVEPGNNLIYIGMWRAETMERWAKAIRHPNNEDGNLWIIEADPRNCQILEIEAERRGLNNVHVINCAIWSSDTEVEFSFQRISDRNFVLDSGIKGKNDLYAPEGIRNVETISAYTFETIMEKAKLAPSDIAHCHMTIGGSEVEAVKGMIKVLRGSGVNLFIKSITSYSDDGVRLSQALINLFNEEGMAFHVTKYEKDGVTPKTLQAIF